MQIVPIAGSPLDLYFSFAVGIFPLALPLALGAGSFLSGLFGGGKQKQKQQTQQQQQQQQTSMVDTATLPQFLPEFQGLNRSLMPIVTDRIMNPKSFSNQLLQRGVSDINRTYGLAEQGLQNRLAAQGLGASPGPQGAGLTSLASARAGDIVGLQRELPLIERQMHDQDLDFAMRYLGLGRGTQTKGTTTGTGTSSGTGTTTSEGTMGGTGLGGALGGLTNTMAFLYASGMLGGRGGQGGAMDAWSRAQPNLANTIGMLPGGQTMPSMNAGWQPPWTLNLADLGMLPGGQYANRTPPYFGY